VFQQGVASSSLGVDTSYDPDLSGIGIHFVAAPIMLLDPSVEHSRSASSLYQVLAHYINKGQIFSIGSIFGVSCISIDYIFRSMCDN
jgi:hypothetical protein